MELNKETLIDAQADVEGKLTGKDARILGRFRGEIQLSGRLSLGEGCRVEATVAADAADIAGAFAGELKARNLLVHEKARVEGTLETQTLTVKEGAQVNGAITAGVTRPKPAAVTPRAAPGAVAG